MEVEENKNRKKNQVKEGLWLTIEGEALIDLESFNLEEFQWHRYIEFENLAYINLNNNKLEYIDGNMFTFFPNLSWLDLRNNQLRTFPIDVKGHFSLGTILIDNNKITELPIELGSLPKLKNITVLNNPLKFPKIDILNQGARSLIHYLRMCWQNQSHEIQFDPFKGKINQISNQIENVGDFVCRNSKSPFGDIQTLVHILVKEIDKRNKQIQKIKDKNALKTWKERYAAYKHFPQIKPLFIPPYGTYEEYSKMPNRADSKSALNNKLKMFYPKTQKNHFEHLTAEIQKIEKAMNDICFAAPAPASTTSDAMTAKIEEIKALKEIQRRINSLRSLYIV